MSDINKLKRRPGAPFGNTNSAGHGRPLKDKEPRNAKVDGRVPSRIRESLESRATGTDSTVADALIEAVEIAQAYGWQMPNRHDGVHTKQSK